MLHCEGGFATDDRRRASRVVGVRTYGLVMVGGQSVTSVERGLALLAAGMEELPAATAAPLETPQLLRALEVARRKVSAVDHQGLSQAAEQGVAVQLGHRTLHQCLADLRARRPGPDPRRGGMRAAAGGDRTAALPDPALYCRGRARRVDRGGAHRIIGQILGKIPAAVPAEVVAHAEKSLAGYAATMSPEGRW